MHGLSVHAGGKEVAEGVGEVVERDAGVKEVELRCPEMRVILVQSIGKGLFLGHNHELVQSLLTYYAALALVVESCFKEVTRLDVH
ncbi:MAG: hypothetical protein DDT39_00257 [Firmicutes bacterium]|nr:hypothetical protein [candidate division NPL-UPA2 bacterium]